MASNGAARIGWEKRGWRCWTTPRPWTKPRARDRAAVRALIARRPPPERQTRISREFDQRRTFTCPVCREFLWKPVIKQCGHAACFLCTHKAMDQLV